MLHPPKERLRFEDIPNMADGDLLLWGAQLKAQITEVQRQIEEWNADLSPSHMDTDEWRDRAQKALGIQRSLLAQVKVEQTKRRVSAETAPPGSRADAFVKAALLLLDKDTIRRVWDLAVATHPDAFNT